MKLHLEMGDQVLGIDNFSSSLRQSLHAIEIHKLCDGGKKGMLLPGDITLNTNAGWVGCLSDFQANGFKHMFDVIYNLACPASPPCYQSMPIEVMMTNVVGTKNVLDLAKSMGSVVVQASTSEVYGEPTVSPQPESYRGNVNPYGPRACYDEGKRAAESLCYDYRNKLGVDARIVRIFNTYGPHMKPDDGRVVSNLVCQALKGEPMTLYGDGRQSRSFCYVADTVDALWVMGNLKENPGGPINVGNPCEVDLNVLVELIKEFTGTKSEVVFKSLPVDDPTNRCPDITRAKELLKWRPMVTLQEGLIPTIAHFRNVLGVKR